MSTMTLELYEAAESGVVAALEELQNQNIDVFAQVSPGGNTALHISAYHGHQSFVEKLVHLINAQSDVEARNEEQKRRFLRAQNKEENNALHETVRGGDHGNIVEELIKADPDLSRIRNRKGESPLFTASANGRLNSVQKLLQVDDPLYARFDGQTCLHHALYYENYEVAVVLLEKNSELRKQEDYFLGNTPLHIAAFRGCPENVIKKLLERDPDTCCYKKDKIKQQTALHVAAEHGHVAVVKCILKFARTCVEITDKDGRTALHCAVENGQVDVVEVLIPAMVRLLNVVDNNGDTALDILLHNFDRVEQPIEYDSICELLRRNDAKVEMEAANKRKKTNNAKVEVETANKRKERKPFRNETVIPQR